MSTTEGWLDVMNRGIDSVDIDYQPHTNNNIYWSLFFIFIIILSNFFMLNLFAGVVVSTFNKEKRILDMTYLLSETQQRWLETKRDLLELRPKKIVD